MVFISILFSTLSNINQTNFVFVTMMSKFLWYFLDYYYHHDSAFSLVFIFSVSPNAIRLRVGSTRRDSGGRIVRVANVTSHALYGQPMYDNDIAALRLARPLNFSANIRAIRLPRPRQGVPLVRLTVTGWGLTAVSMNNFLKTANTTT